MSGPRRGKVILFFYSFPLFSWNMGEHGDCDDPQRHKQAALTRIDDPCSLALLMIKKLSANPAARESPV